MSDDVLVRVENVSKRFCRSLKRSLWYGLQDLGSELGGCRHGGGGGLPQSSGDVELRQDEFWAVKDVSFELRRGECLGLIGRNGAGKTTLLRMLNGLIKPDTGQIKMLGRVGALIALGAGFNPVLSGRENIYVNASVMGFGESEIEEKLEEIIDFAEIGDFIDAPLQTYSSGMQVRLGFAASTILDPDVLILDEVLAVGDTSFRYKCYRRMDEMRSRSAVIFVSHDMPNIGRICNLTMVMQKGQPIFNGSALEGISIYDELNEDSKEQSGAGKTVNYPIVDVAASVIDAPRAPGDRLYLNLQIETRGALTSFYLIIYLQDSSGDHIATLKHEFRGSDGLRRGVNAFRLTIESIPLRNNLYHIGVALTDTMRQDLLFANSRATLIRISEQQFPSPSPCILSLHSFSRCEPTGGACRLQH
jgi:lipopolysaccharide transport system ATP-binding protein